MARVSLDDSSSAKVSGRGGSKPSPKAAGADPRNRTKLILVGVIAFAAILVAGYQIVPTVLGGRSADAGTGPDVTEPVQANSTDLAPGAVEPPVVPKPRGAGKRPGG